MADPIGGVELLAQAVKTLRDAVLEDLVRDTVAHDGQVDRARARFARDTIGAHVMSLRLGTVSDPRDAGDPSAAPVAIMIYNECVSCDEEHTSDGARSIVLPFGSMWALHAILGESIAEWEAKGVRQDPGRDVPG